MGSWGLHWTSLHARIWPQISMDQGKDEVRWAPDKVEVCDIEGYLGQSQSPPQEGQRQNKGTETSREKVRNWENEITPH